MPIFASDHAEAPAVIGGLRPGCSPELQSVRRRLARCRGLVATMQICETSRRILRLIELGQSIIQRYGCYACC